MIRLSRYTKLVVATACILCAYYFVDAYNRTKSVLAAFLMVTACFIAYALLELLQAIVFGGTGFIFDQTIREIFRDRGDRPINQKDRSSNDTE